MFRLFHPLALKVRQRQVSDRFLLYISPQVSQCVHHEHLPLSVLSFPTLINFVYSHSQHHWTISRFALIVGLCQSRHINVWVKQTNESMSTSKEGGRDSVEQLNEGRNGSKAPRNGSTKYMKVVIAFGSRSDWQRLSSFRMTSAWLLCRGYGGGHAQDLQDATVGVCPHVLSLRSAMRTDDSLTLSIGRGLPGPITMVPKRGFWAQATVRPSQQTFVCS